MDAEEMKKRFKDFAIGVANLTRRLTDNEINLVYKRQIIRSSSSAGANYRASRRAKSTNDFINKLKIVEEELDESLYFLEILEPLNPDHTPTITSLYSEGESLLKIIVASIKSSRK